MKLALERHAYAPELNRAHILKGGRVVAILPAPQCRTIAEARKALFAPTEPRRLVTAYGEREAPWNGYNRSRSAAYRLEAGVMARILRDAREALADSGGALLDGRTMPPNRVRVESRLAWIERR